MEYFESILEIWMCSQKWMYTDISTILCATGQTKIFITVMNDIRIFLTKYFAHWSVKISEIELNTGGYHYGLGEPNPCTAVIRRYRELGGEIITVGADAHSPEKISFAFDKAAKVLSDCGFRYYTVFKNRKPEFIRLS